VFAGHFISSFSLHSYDAMGVLLKEGQQRRFRVLSPCNFGESHINQRASFEGSLCLLVLPLTANLAMNLTSSTSCPVLLES